MQVLRKHSLLKDLQMELLEWGCDQILKAKVEKIVGGPNYEGMGTPC